MITKQKNKNTLYFLDCIWETLVVELFVKSLSYFCLPIQLNSIKSFVKIYSLSLYNDNILKNCGILLMNDLFLCLLSIYLFIVDVKHFENILLKEIMGPKIWTATKKNIFLCFFQNYHIHYESKYKIILLTIYSN